MPLEKPASVASDAFKSAKWDELTEGRDFPQSDAPTLEVLCQWYAVMQRCMDDIDDAGGQVAYANDLGDIKAIPQIAVMKQASAEIRQLSKQLGIAGGGARKAQAPAGRPDVLSLVTGSRDRRARAAG